MRIPYRLLVLIIEDDEWAAGQFARTLEQAGFRTRWVTNAAAGVDELDAHRPDVILLDVFLTGPTAFVLLHELRSHKDLANIPIVVCTNSAAEVQKIDLAPYGVAGVLDKTTMQPGDVASAISRALLW